MTLTDEQECDTNTLVKSFDPNTLEWYIAEVCDGMDLHTFESHTQAYEFGHEVRNKCPELEVEINLTTVRLRLKNYED